MGANSGIEWTDHTFNPWWGCVKVSPACDHCYAETFAKRTGHQVWGHESPRRFFGDAHWAEPLKWNAAAAKAGKPARVFCASMGDVFEKHPALNEPRARLWTLIEQTPDLIWLLLTKRPENIEQMVPASWLERPLLQVWYGTTAETQAWLLRRLKYLLRVPHAGKKFISFEPLLERIDPYFFEMAAIDWCIVGGESGAHARPMDPEWVRVLRDYCQQIGIAFFFKQWGGINKKANGKQLDGREWCEVPRP